MNDEIDRPSSAGRPQATRPGLAGRRTALKAVGAAGALAAVAPSAPAATPPPDRRPGMITRPIPRTDEALPVIGCGTWIGFDHAPGSETYRRLPGVLDALFAAGGRLIDSSPMYGRAEETAGELLAGRGGPPPFLATKVWTEGRRDGVRQMEQSMTRLRSPRIDLMQIHNLVDWRTHLATLRDWKAQGRIRYIGLTHYTAGAYPALADAMRSAKDIDFVQFNYAIDAREAEATLLPLAQDLGLAVIVNLPFGGGGLLRGLRDRPLPGWAAEIGADSWAQLLLKFVLGHPAVTCTIPGTSRPEHMAENARAGTGPLPPRAFWTDKLAALGF